MKKTLTTLAILALLTPFYADAVSVGWDRYVVGSLRTLYSGDKVLIGATATTTSANLEVIGDAYVSGTTTSPCFSNDGSTCITSSGSGTVNSGTTGQVTYYATDGTAVSGTSTLTITTDERVGIGTTTPTAQLHVYANRSDVYGPIIELYGSATSTQSTALNLIHRTTEAIADGFGLDLRFNVASLSATQDTIARISAATEDGDPTSGFLFLTNYASGVAQPAVTLANDGNLSVGGIQSGSARFLVYKSSPGANDVLIQAGTTDDSNRFAVDEDGDVTGDGRLTMGSTIQGLKIQSNLSGSVSDPHFSFAADTNTGFYKNGAGNINRVGISTNGIAAVLIDENQLVSIETTLEIPNGTAPVANDPGEIAHDTTDNQLILDDFVLPTTQSIWSATIASTSVDFISGGSIPLPMKRDGFTITEISCWVVGGTSVVINIDSAAGGSNTDTVTCDTDGATDTSITSNPTRTANSLNVLEIGTITGSPDYLSFSVSGQWTRE